MFKNLWRISKPNLNTLYSTLNKNAINNINSFTFIKNTNFAFTTSNASHAATINKLSDIRLNNLKPIKGSRIPRNILGRGPGSGKGKTSGRGHKGFTARTGEPARHFEGGSTAISRRVPKRGFSRRGIKTQYNSVNFQNLFYYINKGRLDPTKVITIKDLFECGAITKIKDGVKLLSKGVNHLNKYPKLNLEVSDASQSAIDAIKASGGSIDVKYRTKLTLRHHVLPYKFDEEVMDPIPPVRKVLRLNHLREKGAK